MDEMVTDYLVADYLVATCTWQEYKDKDDDEFGTSYGEPETLKCYKYDNATFGRAFKFEGQNIINAPAKTYLISDLRVREGDLIDGQVIASINDFMDFDGRIILKECLLA